MRVASTSIQGPELCMFLNDHIGKELLYDLTMISALAFRGNRATLTRTCYIAAAESAFCRSANRRKTSASALRGLGTAVINSVCRNSRLKRHSRVGDWTRRG